MSTVQIDSRKSALVLIDLQKGIAGRALAPTWGSVVSRRRSWRDSVVGKGLR